MKIPRRNRPLLYAFYANAVLLLCILVTMASRGGNWMPIAAGAPLSPAPIAGNGNLYLMPAQLLNSTWGCYVMDIQNQTLCAYAYNGNQIKLIASRYIGYDHQLGNYNTHPDPEEIRKLVMIEKQGLRGAPEAPATQESPKP